MEQATAGREAMGDYYGAWRAMEEAYKAGTVKAIGVCRRSGCPAVEHPAGCSGHP